MFNDAFSTLRFFLRLIRLCIYCIIGLAIVYFVLDWRYRTWQRHLIYFNKTGICPGGEKIKNHKAKRKTRTNIYKKKKKCNHIGNLPNCRY